MSDAADEPGPARACWRDRDVRVFGATVRAAAEQLDVQPLAVEKDYWVCRALNGIVRDHSGAVVFKGGTSLEKLRIIQRFSEDLDLLVVADVPKVRAAKRLMDAMCSSAATETGGELADLVSGGGVDGAAWRSRYLRTPLQHATDAPPGVADPERVLLELGQTGGQVPSGPHPVQSLLSRQLEMAGTDVTSWSDLAPFDTTILHPGRTLLEKLLRMNNFPALTNLDGTHGWPRIGRQFYDVWACLGDGRVQALLADRVTALHVIQDARAISEKYGRPDAPVPVGGFSRSPVFDPTLPYAKRLRAEHEAAMSDLYYGPRPGPTFDEVLDRLQENAEFLDLSG